MMVRQVDSSLMEEWEKLRNPNAAPKEAGPELRPPGAEEAAQDVTRDEKGFMAMVRSRVFLFLRAVEDEELEMALGLMSDAGRGDGSAWTVEALFLSA